MGGAKEGGAFLNEFLDAGFSSAVALRAHRNSRTKSGKALACDVVAMK